MVDDDAREFVIPVRRRWKLYVLPVLALLYFVVIITMAALRLEVRNVSTQMLVLAGVAFFVLVALIELPFLFTRRVRPDVPEAPSRMDMQDEAPEPRGYVDDERLVTDETQQGLRVLEYSKPAKSRHRGAVYAKTYVPVTKEHVLRIETLAAEGADL